MLAWAFVLAAYLHVNQVCSGETKAHVISHKSDGQRGQVGGKRAK